MSGRAGTIHEAARGFEHAPKPYEIGRPAYPSEAIERLVAELRIEDGTRVLDLAAGTGEYFRIRPDFDPRHLARAPRALEEFVERVVLEAPEGEPLALELAQFIEAVMGTSPIAVSGAEGREALEAALRIVAAIDDAHRAMKQNAGADLSQRTMSPADPLSRA